MPKKTRPATATAVRGAVARLQRDGKIALRRVEKEVRKLARQTDGATLRREVASRLKEAEGDLERRIVALEKGLRARLGLADAEDVKKLTQRVAGLDRRIADVERRASELTDQLHDVLPSARG